MVSENQLKVEMKFSRKLLMQSIFLSFRCTQLVTWVTFTLYSLSVRI